MILKRIAPLPWARAIAGFAVMVALVGATLSSLAIEYISYLMGLEQLGMGYEFNMSWMVVLGTVLYGALAFVGGLCSALVYNACARLFGGVEFQLRQRSDHIVRTGEQ